MLKRLKLTNFRQHRDLEIDFAQGMLALRGVNESGKSGLQESIKYAFFGSRFLRQPLEEVVTWHQPLSTLRVELTFTVDGVDYTITRSKSGAELRYAGGVVTGQNEVSGYVERLFGAPADTASFLWFADQTSIRGALGKGSKATSQLIEELADFGLIDRLVDLIQTHLPTGQAKPYEERVRQAERFLAEVPGGVEPDAALLECLKDAQKQVVDFTAEYATEKAKAEAFGATVVNPLLQATARYREAVKAYALQEAGVKAKRGELASLLCPGYDAAEHARVRALVAEEKLTREQAAKRTAAYAAFQKLPAVDGVEWQGTLASFEEFVLAEAAKFEQARADVQGLKTQKALASKDLVHSSICGMCGKDVSELPEAAAKNAKAQSELARVDSELVAASDRLTECAQTQEAIKAISAMQKAYLAFTGREFVQQFDDRVPVRLEWVGPAPQDTVATDNSKVLANLDAIEKAVASYHARKQLLEEQLAAQEADLTGLAAAVGTEPSGLEDAMAKHGGLEQAAQALQARIAASSQAAAEFRRTYDQQEALWQQAQKSREQAKELLESAQAELDALTFNNALLKKVRAARPMIVDRLWNVVLNAVAYHFSAMRGEPSTVTRDEGEFHVNGKGIGGLSGSTLDILGLSIRLSLLMTFLPRVSFMMLDEPAAACDDDRETKMLAAVAAANFDQVLCASHSDILESFAAQLITV